MPFLDRVPSVGVLNLIFYGMNELGVEIENPFGPSPFRGTPDCNESAALHSYSLDSSLSLRVLQNFDRENLAWPAMEIQFIVMAYTGIVEASAAVMIVTDQLPSWMGVVIFVLVPVGFFLFQCYIIWATHRGKNAVKFVEDDGEWVWEDDEEHEGWLASWGLLFEARTSLYLGAC